ncbi:MAG TPA: ABC transporter permease [Candidatus Limnocylindria bacterium]|nr:ABC transporter permease [Candidatus Limnocylindria bacterium]
MRQALLLTFMYFRAYIRDRTAVFFSLVVPLMLLLIFGSLNLGAFGKVSLAVDDQASNAASQQFVSGLETIDTLSIKRESSASGLAALKRTELDMLLVVPKDFAIAPTRAGQAVPTLTIYGNDARPQQVSVGGSIINEVITRLSFAVNQTAPVIGLKQEDVQGVRLRYVDFLVPGIIGVNVMQLAIFSVAFALVVDKRRGVLRRIMATPLKPSTFLVAQVLTRLILATLQVLIMIGVSVVLFDVHPLGGILPLLLVALLGAVLFLTIGFALAGWAENENQAPAIAQLITLPQFFFSGVFFSKEAAPEVIRPITNLLPLTFLNDALREISVQGATLWDVRTQILGLLVWTAIGLGLAVRLFRFDRF